jgi:hypothetical protein
MRKTVKAYIGGIFIKGKFYPDVASANLLKKEAKKVYELCIPCTITY